MEGQRSVCPETGLRSDPGEGNRGTGLPAALLQAGAVPAGESIPMSCLGDFFPIRSLLVEGAGVKDLEQRVMA